MADGLTASEVLSDGEGEDLDDGNTFCWESDSSDNGYLVEVEGCKEISSYC